MSVKCIKCRCFVMERTLHRTGEIGKNPEWMCEPCILKYHDKSVIDEQVKAITDIIQKDNESNRRY